VQFAERGSREQGGNGVRLRRRARTNCGFTDLPDGLILVQVVRGSSQRAARGFEISLGLHIAQGRKPQQREEDNDDRESNGKAAENRQQTAGRRRRLGKLVSFQRGIGRLASHGRSCRLEPHAQGLPPWRRSRLLVRHIAPLTPFGRIPSSQTTADRAPAS
jgi:hypothetical protein